eukprot:TRINITY_DN19561_c0_g1_i1.p1 TRINITY_DN19561_c0_g1~~TRINITY_DN19561_c0_g1_i1.p1  ORF type:complete len:205 (-),score=31.89 TRINITY_DN19561_c0_g1_i1:390-1004(-)
MPERQGTHPVPFGGWRHRAAHFYTLLVLFSFPLFSVPCLKGQCSSPVEVVAVDLLAKGVWKEIVKAILYPSALFSKLESIVSDNEQISLPDWNSPVEEIGRQIRENERISRASGLGLTIGCYLAIAGAIACVLGPTYLSALGPLIILWSVYYEHEAKEAYLLPMFSIAVFCSLSGALFLGKTPQQPKDSGSQSTDSSSNQKKEN